MRKLMLVAAMLAMVLAVAVPAFAQDTVVVTDNEQEQEQNQDQAQYSGDVTTGGATATGGDESIVQQCAAILNQVNTGNQGAQQGNQAQISGDVSADQAGDEADITITEDQEEASQNQNQYNLADQDIAFTAEQVQYCEQVVAQANNNVVAEDSNVATGEESVAGNVGTTGTTGGAAAAGGGGGGAAAAGGGGGGAAASGGGGGAAQLPATGGFSLLTLGAGALLVAGGLVARRIVR